MALRTAACALVLLAQSTFAIDLNPDSTNSVKDAASTIAYDLMSNYDGNQTGSGNVGFFKAPYYWWEGAVTWSALISYWAYTNDSSYNPTVIQALTFQAGPDHNYMPPNQTKTLGQDDQSFWALACMDALELGFPKPPSDQPQYLELAVNTWNTMAARWSTNEVCGGGLRWAIFSFNNGYNYKNSQSNGNFFQLSARLARYTGNSTYIDWADKTYKWMESVGLISDYSVYDGIDVGFSDCSQINHLQWTANNAVLLYGSAVLSSATNGSSVWQDRAVQFFNSAVNIFVVKGNSSSSPVISEVACESSGTYTCNADQAVFQGLLARWMAKAAVLVPAIREQSYAIIKSSAQAAAASCSSGDTKTACGQTWTGRGNNPDQSVSEQLSALNVVQALLYYNATGVPMLKQGQANNASTSTTGSGGSSNSTTGGNTTTQNGTTASGGTTGAATALSTGSHLTAFFVVVFVGFVFQQLM